MVSWTRLLAYSVEAAVASNSYHGACGPKMPGDKERGTGPGSHWRKNYTGSASRGHSELGAADPLAMLMDAWSGYLTSASDVEQNCSSYRSSRSLVVYGRCMAGPEPELHAVATAARRPLLQVASYASTSQNWFEVLLSCSLWRA